MGAPPTNPPTHPPMGRSGFLRSKWVTNVPTKLILWRFFSISLETRSRSLEVLSLKYEQMSVDFYRQQWYQVPWNQHQHKSQLRQNDPRNEDKSQTISISSNCMGPLGTSLGHYPRIQGGSYASTNHISRSLWHNFLLGSTLVQGIYCKETNWNALRFTGNQRVFQPSFSQNCSAENIVLLQSSLCTTVHYSCHQIH